MRPFALVLALLLVGACAAVETRPGTLVPLGGAGRAGPTTSVAAPALTGAAASLPAVELRGGGRQLSLRPWSFCWFSAGQGVCADGLPPRFPPDIGDADEIEVGFAVPGLRFTATAERAGETCGREQSTPLEATGPTTYRLRPIGPAGDYVITLFGKGKDAAGTGGDLVVSFRWHTPSDGANEAPSATIGILSGQPPEVGSVGVGLDIFDLRTTPRPGRARASAAVTSSNGASMPIELMPKDVPCAGEGSASFTASEALGAEAARLGPAPFRYEITLVLDGTTYRGLATWPDDQDPECSPCTRLRFDPPLPGL